MMAFLTEPLPRYWMIGLLAGWGLFLFGGFLLGSGDESHRMPTWTRMASSIALVIAGWSWFWLARDGEIRPFALFIALGMTFGLLGDLVLAGLLPGGAMCWQALRRLALGMFFTLPVFCALVINMV